MLYSLTIQPILLERLWLTGHAALCQDEAQASCRGNP